MAGVLDAKRAVITGAGTGLGAATACAFAAEGAVVTLVGRREEKLRETVAAVQAIGGTAIVVPGDVAVEDTAKRAVDASDGVLTRTTAVEYADEAIRANCVCPGGMEPVERADLDATGRAKLREAAAAAGGFPLHRVAHVAEVAQLLLFLAGPNAASMTGAVIPFDGGFTAK